MVCVVFLRPWEGVGATSVSSNWDQLGTKLIRKSQWAPTNRSSQQGQRRAGVPAGPSIRAWGLLRVGGAVEKGQLPLYVYLDSDFLISDGQLFMDQMS